MTRNLNAETMTVSLIKQYLNRYADPNCHLVAADGHGNVYPILTPLQYSGPLQMTLMLGEPVLGVPEAERKRKRDEMIAQASKIACDTVLHPSPLGNLLRELVNLVFDAESNVARLEKRLEERPADTKPDEVKLDYQVLLDKYMYYISIVEGTSYVECIRPDHVFSEAEVASLRKMEEARMENLPPRHV